MSTRITTEVLGDHPPLSQIATSLPLSTSWIRGGDGLIGFGRHKTLKISGPKRFQEADAWWKNELSQFEIHNNVHGSGTGPILFTSFAFLDESDSEIIIPEIVIGLKNGTSWITWVGDQNQPEIRRVTPNAGRILKLNWLPGSIDADAWKERVASAVEKIRSNGLEKVVLARDIHILSNSTISARSIISALEEEYPSTWLFLVQNLVGATPELLVRLSKSLVTSRVLAGTIRKSGNEQQDLGLAASLAKSSKDLEEHEYAVQSVVEAIAPYCSSTNVPDSPFVLHLSNVMHLATDVTGVVNESATPVNLFTLMKSLHPSAAVCGTPTAKALETIQGIEGMDRGRYAGPVGWVDARGDGEIGIALRCGQISNDELSITLYAGCGIVAGSDPEAEFLESQAKLLPMRTALETL